MINLFNTGIEHYYTHISLMIMIAVTFEFYISGAYKQDTILLCSDIVLTLCIAMYIVNHGENGEFAIVFSTLSYVALNIYSQFFRRKGLANV